ncbi:hypothetical protein ABD91_26105 [Lysinibacillus sphaericus]|uniref:hypothetical protein n=1 Tax=Lysinibacillus sphaericus TaxID=1421 RepID=UPI0018CE8F83|nr:hypothetical protein [Lysinibacillus sphaericus]MBG9694207.1 hypothetical protein [Lysinibacillus sphaericus]
MEQILATAAMHPMARFIMESDQYDPYEQTFYQTEEKNLMSLLLIYIEVTTKVLFRNPFLREEAIKSLHELLDQLNDFSSIQNLLAANRVSDEMLNQLWETDAFFIVSPLTDKVFHEQDIMRKNVCLITLKKRIKRLSFPITN